MAGSELGILSSQCLDRRIPDKENLVREVAAWQTRRNKLNAKAQGDSVLSVAPKFL
jgi:hypothetical protein